jgi:predicted transcriptional regulator
VCSSDLGRQLAMKAESLYKIATLMGNSPEICQRHYAAVVPESLHTTVEFIQENSCHQYIQSG